MNHIVYQCTVLYYYQNYLVQPQQSECIRSLSELVRAHLIDSKGHDDSRRTSQPQPLSILLDDSQEKSLKGSQS